MKSKFRFSPILFALFYAVTVAADQPPLAQLTLDPASTLPGLPVAFVVSLTNPNDQPAVILDAMKLRVTSETAVFDATGIGGTTQLTLPADAADCGGIRCLTIPAHGQKQLYVNFEASLGANEFFADQRLAQPGTYSLQLVLYARSSSGPPIELQSNPATLTVKTPTGVDAQVWTYLQQQSPTGVWSLIQWAAGGNAAADAIRSAYPTSSYVPWVAALGKAPTTTVWPAVDDALKTNLTPSLRDDLMLSKASFLAACARSALYNERDVQKALSLSDDARRLYQQLQKNALSDVIRQTSSDALQHLYTPTTAQSTLDMLSAGDPPAPAHLTPRVECVSPGQGQAFSARFGYSNPNSAKKIIPVGNLNQVTPAPRDQGQPRIFKPGDHAAAFVATSSGGDLIWHLDGGEAVATRNFNVPCNVTP